MEQTKEQTLTNLYALRAGLSVISQENDKACGIQTNYQQEISDEFRKKVCGPLPLGFFSDSEHKAFYDSYGDDYTSPFSERNKVINRIFEDKFVYEVERAKKKKKGNLIASIISFAISLIFLLITLAALATCIYFIVQNFKIERYWLAVLLIIAGVFVALGIMLLWTFWVKDAFDNAISNDVELSRCSTLLNNFSEIKNSLQAMIIANKNELAPIKSGCENLYVALQKEYNQVLDVRDWQHLDLVIFYLETRRADSVKEALQLVDRELQTQRIENIIIAATKQICNTLAIGFTMLQDTMVTCCNKLSAQIAQASAVQSAQLTQLTTAVNMGNALKAKANVTSEQLMNDVKQIRNLVCN